MKTALEIHSYHMANISLFVILHQLKLLKPMMFSKKLFYFSTNASNNICY